MKATKIVRTAPPPEPLPFVDPVAELQTRIKNKRKARREEDLDQETYMNYLQAADFFALTPEETAQALIGSGRRAIGGLGKPSGYATSIWNFLSRRHGWGVLARQASFGKYGDVHNIRTELSERERERNARRRDRARRSA